MSATVTQEDRERACERLCVPGRVEGCAGRRAGGCFHCTEMAWARADERERFREEVAKALEGRETAVHGTAIAVFCDCAAVVRSLGAGKT